MTDYKRSARSGICAMVTATANWRRQGADGLAQIDLAQRVPEARRAHDELAGEKQRPGERVAPIARRGVNLGRQGGRF